LILTGTPSGVGPICAGDRLEAKIDNWPPLRISVVNARWLNPLSMQDRRFLRVLISLPYIPQAQIIRII